MSDPFADIDGIIQAQEEEVPLAKSTLLGGDAASGGDEISYLERFPRELQSKAALDMKYRMEMEKAIHSAMIELHDVREQLYLVRFDGSRSQEECKKAVENYICEIERLEAKVTKLREKLLENYMKSLSLDQLRMSGPLITTSLRHNRSMIPQSGGSSQMERLFSEGSLSRGENRGKYGRAMSRNELEGTQSAFKPHEDESLLRKVSFGLLGIKSPGNLPKSPNVGYREASMHNPNDRRSMTNEEIATIRATLYSLRQQKELSPADEERVEILTAKLRALNEL
mmetsp:Transcript_14644/g.20420  ORF Transcript_14644/g.20420 Transcript_14644/m.20420 type:complete len:283 (+) Transcript_14644:115-963(+)|eukprot:CAMPEP_0201490200 /NCGR_PEP_ID=MMETSP0151_2-20130828/25470_1 /ASSEMBLY_ACC=CAM_ASM_000257 /TAXON_ID=200890 /ORGANISM="Paramoeba atlantica, Strain 621/1 / CCAP 1560/9" /LENGTH=282 /DNA_ID=CAMNT_0047876061 /DNA_START=78 /DNA_END=926 /DNA_ORIENTATION=+